MIFQSRRERSQPAQGPWPWPLPTPSGWTGSRQRCQIPSPDIAVPLLSCFYWGCNMMAVMKSWKQWLKITSSKLPLSFTSLSFTSVCSDKVVKESFCFEKRYNINHQYSCLEVKPDRTSCVCSLQHCVRPFGIRFARRDFFFFPIREMMILQFWYFKKKFVTCSSRTAGWERLRCREQGRLMIRLLLSCVYWQNAN